MKIAAKQTVQTYEGADARTLYFMAKQSDGTAFDLTGYVVTLKAINGSGTKIDDEECTLADDETTGGFSYTPAAAEINEAGAYRAQVKLSLTVGEATTVNYLEEFILEVLAVL